MDRVAVIRLVVLGLLVTAALPAGAHAGNSPGTTDRTLGLPADIDPDSVLLSIDVAPDGDARWHVEYRVRLATENETEAFRSLQNDIEANESQYVSDFATGIRSTVRNAENTTGREMTATNFTVNAEIKQLPQEYGVITYTFTWGNFAVAEGDRLRIGDALSGFFLDSETSLLFSYPKEYSVVSVQPEPTERRESAVLWTGRLDFTAGEPELVVSKAAGTTTTTAGATTEEPREGPVQNDASTWIPLLIGGISVTLLLAVALYLYFQRGDLSTPIEETGGSEGGGAGGVGTAGAGAAGAEGGTEEAEEEPEEESETEPPEELLSNEERVKRFLDEQGGRAKQQEVVDAMGWTEAKTSQVVKKMRENDELESFRIGRENVLKLPEEGEEGEL